jgi:hypothetical protein
VRLVWFIPAVLAVVTDVLTASIVIAHQPDYPDRVRVSDRDGRGGFVGGDSENVGADHGIGRAVGRGLHLNGGRIALRSNCDCCRVGYGR